MAGGLVGAILGGALGAGVQQMAFSESPAARMLAKIQTQGRSCLHQKLQQLDQRLGRTYNQILELIWNYLITKSPKSDTT